MKQRILQYFKHLGMTLVILLPILLLFGYANGMALHYGDDPKVMNWENEGPYLFYKNDSLLQLSYIKGDQDKGFYLSKQYLKTDSVTDLVCYNPFDNSSFAFQLETTIQTPPSSYDDGQPILAISDIESNYIVFRNFLINNKVIDEDLRWTFGRGHLVLVGDFVDRGFFTTQVLWFIYKLEQDAKEQGGTVHYILGNHELKTMQGDYSSASPKYYHIASILGKQQHELYDNTAVLGRWMASKNALEIVNGYLFVHGGIHPDIAEMDLSVASINQIIRDRYFQPFYPQQEESVEQFLISSHTGPCWYRGYFKADLSQAEVDQGLNTLGAKAVVVGHTIQQEVNKRYDGKVIGIDIQFAGDHYQYWPPRRAQGLYIDGGKCYRLLDNGEQEESDQT